MNVRSSRRHDSIAAELIRHANRQEQGKAPFGLEAARGAPFEQLAHDAAQVASRRVHHPAFLNLLQPAKPTAPRSARFPRRSAFHRAIPETDRNPPRPIAYSISDKRHAPAISATPTPKPTSPASPASAVLKPYPLPP